MLRLYLLINASTKGNTKEIQIRYKRNTNEIQMKYISGISLSEKLNKKWVPLHQAGGCMCRKELLSESKIFTKAIKILLRAEADVNYDNNEDNRQT